MKQANQNASFNDPIIPPLTTDQIERTIYLDSPHYLDLTFLDHTSDQWEA